MNVHYKTKNKSEKQRIRTLNIVHYPSFVELLFHYNEQRDLVFVAAGLEPLFLNYQLLRDPSHPMKTIRICFMLIFPVLWEHYTVVVAISWIQKI